MTITKAHLAEELSCATRMTHKEAYQFVDLFFEEIIAALEQGGEVKLTNFGRFDLQDKKARPGRDFQTGEPIQIEPRRVVSFRASSKLKKAIESLTTEATD